MAKNMRKKFEFENMHDDMYDPTLPAPDSSIPAPKPLPEFAVKLRALRGERGLREVSALWNIPISTLSRAENGHLSDEHKEQILKIVGLDE